MSVSPVSETIIHQSPRQLPYLTTETLSVYPLTSPSGPQFTTLIVSVMALVGLSVSILIYSRVSSGNSELILGFVAISGVTMLGSLVAFLFQFVGSRRDTRELVRRFEADLEEKRAKLAQLDTLECAARNALQPPTSGITQIWQRRPSDEDFLLVRVGLGKDVPHYTVKLGDTADRVTLPPKHKKLAKANEEAKSLVERYQQLQNLVPVAVSLLQYPVIALCSGDQNATAATNVARELAAQIVLNHSPLDVHIMVVGPHRQIDSWSWLFGSAYQKNRLPQFGFLRSARDQLFESLLDTLLRRETALSDKGSADLLGRNRDQTAALPHLVVIIDAFSPEDKLAEATPLATAMQGAPDFAGSASGAGAAVSGAWRSPLSDPALALALRKGGELGVTVITVQANKNEAPAETGLLIDCQRQSLIPIKPPHTAEIEGIAFDKSAPADFQAVTSRLAGATPESDKALTLSSDVRLLSLFAPPISDPTTHDVRQMWQMIFQHSHGRPGERERFAIPLGEKLGGNPVLLDLTGDGPHGLLIGQTGSGKSELLQSMIMALALQYTPDQVNFVLVDYKGGLSMENCARLPHTIAFLTNLAHPSQSARFLTFLEAEMLDRQRKQERKEQFPRLFVVIDEFAELVTRRQENDQTDTIVDNLLRVLRLGRQLKVHLLFAAQRPEGSVTQRLRGYVQYRICLRVNTDEDSRDVLGRSDAASLPMDTPGRGYLLRGDRELTLFQAARVTAPFIKDDPVAGKTSEPTDLILLDRICRAAPTPLQQRWPDALPTPTFQNPTPLALFADEEQRRLFPSLIVWKPSDTGMPPRMVIPLGIFDRPSQKLQDWLQVDLWGHQGPLSGGPLIVRGDANSGKSTTLQTLLLYLLTAVSPDQLRLYIVDANSSLVDFCDETSPAPHLRDWSDPALCNYVDAADLDAVRAMHERFERAIAAPPAQRPALLLVADDFDEASSRQPAVGFTDKNLILDMMTAAIQNRRRQVYLACSAARPGAGTAMTAVLNGMMTRIVLYMNDRDAQRAILGNRLPYGSAAPTPGRGFVQTRATLDEAQIAAPVPGANDAIRIANLQAAIRAVCAHWAGGRTAHAPALAVVRYGLRSPLRLA